MRSLVLNQRRLSAQAPHIKEEWNQEDARDKAEKAGKHIKSLRGEVEMTFVDKLGEVNGREGDRWVSLVSCMYTSILPLYQQLLLVLVHSGRHHCSQCRNHFLRLVLLLCLIFI